MMKTGYKKMRCALIGEHLGHSFSRIIHEKIADYSYDLVELTPDRVGDFVKNGGYDAFNVTIPYKKAVIPYLDRISPEAHRIGAVNTVVRRADGSLDGYNTDYFGFSRMIDALGVDPVGKKAVVLGSGGASVTVQTVLADSGAGEIIVVGRAIENNYGNIDRHYDADIIVNTTPVGMYPNNGECPVELSNFKKCGAVLDLIYNPAKTRLLLEAEALGIPHINGLYMLAAQAVRAYELFTSDSAESGIIERITDEISFATKNIILIGMPGCGKSTVGKLIAQKTSRTFFDADDEFTAMHGVTPAEAINTMGEEGFRVLEHKTLCSLGKNSGAVIACGGGAVTREYNYAPLHQNGIIVYLRRELSRLATNGRPLSQSRSVESLYKARKEAYERFADVTADSTEIPEKTAELILNELEKQGDERKEK